jgi:hypothetical protein
LLWGIVVSLAKGFSLDLAHVLLVGAFASVVIAIGSAPARAQNLIIYPSKGQSYEQQSKDEGECGQWAQQQTGYSPYSSGASQSSGRPALRGAAKGAAVGAIGGAIGGNAGKGAAIGAGVGAAVGLSRKNQAVRADEAQRSEYTRAFATCMSGRGYTVS